MNEEGLALLVPDGVLSVFDEMEGGHVCGAFGWISHKKPYFLKPAPISMKIYSCSQLLKRILSMQQTLELHAVSLILEL